MYSRKQNRASRNYAKTRNFKGNKYLQSDLSSEDKKAIEVIRLMAMNGDYTPPIKNRMQRRSQNR